MMGSEGMDMMQEGEQKNSVTITDNGDGTFSVQSPEQEDAAENGGAEGQAAQANSLQDALRMAGQMLQAGGQNDRAGIAKQVFGGEERQAGQLARKPMGQRY